MTENKKCVVAFDTSNYTTSVAVCTLEGEVVANLKAPLPVKEGERGLRQSDAVFAHTKNLPALCKELGEALKELEPIAVGVSATPRRAEGSYMPCFLCGVAAANSFAAAKGLPIYESSHQHGHIMAAAYSSGCADKLMSGRFLAFHVSGGTTEALLVTPSADKTDFEIELVGQTKTDFEIELVGQTNDINAGLNLRPLSPQATRYSFLRDIASNTCFLVRKDCCKVHYVLLSPRSPVLKVVKYVVKKSAPI